MSKIGRVIRELSELHDFQRRLNHRKRRQKERTSATRICGATAPTEEIRKTAKPPDDSADAVN